jgi:hypothetical protein
MSNCTIAYYRNGVRQGLIAPEVADEFERDAKKLGWLVLRTPLTLEVVYKRIP